MKVFTITILTMSMASGLAFGFGGKKLGMAELSGVTETQVSPTEKRAMLMVRGKAAELIYRKLMTTVTEKEQVDSAALAAVNGKGATHWTVEGKQVYCSHIVNEKKKTDDYACGFSVDQKGSVAAGNEPFDPQQFNLANTATGSKMFRKQPNRMIASVDTSSSNGVVPAVYSKGQGYVLYDDPKTKRKSEDALIILKGDSAKAMMTFLKGESWKDEKSWTWNGVKGVKGEQVACVEPTEKEPYRCSMVVGLKNGNVTREGNPLFR